MSKMITNGGDFAIGPAPKKNVNKRSAARVLTLDAWRGELEGRRVAKTLTPFAGKTGARAADASKRQKAARGAFVDLKRAKMNTVAAAPRKNDTKAAARLAALEDLTSELKNKRGFKKKNDMDAKRDTRFYDAQDRQREDRAALVESKRKKNTTMKAAEKVVEKEVREAQKGDLDLSDLTFEQVEALKEFGGLSSNLTREQIDEIIGRVSPLTEGGRPFVVSTPIPTARFLPARRLKVNDVATGRKIVL
jgi:hypothetical protein